jgi:protein-tyrosine phosphatase
VRYVRRIEFDGMVNFRDLGGLPANGGRIRRRRLFRSDSVAYASGADVARLVDELRLATLIDLRGESEVALLGRGLMRTAAVTYVSAPIVDVTSGQGLARHYVAMLEERGAVLASLIRRLTEPAALPALFHCEAGCDRTGVLAAITLDLLGVPDEEICADYAQTAQAISAINERIRQNLIKLNLPAPKEYPDSSWGPTEAVMAETLDRMRQRWGCSAGWARAYGLRPAEIDALREALIDGAGGSREAPGGTAGGSREAVGD